MKYISIFIFIILFVANIQKSYAEDSLTMKQQVDRIIEEVKDLNLAVFNKSFDKNNLYSNDIKNDREKFSSIDIRIYDLDKDIENLTFQFEEILFKLDDLSLKINSLESNLSSKFLTNSDNSNNINKNLENFSSSDINDENTLGKIILSNNEQELEEINSTNKTEENKNKILKQELELEKLSPEELLQLALDQMMKKNYENSKKILKAFVIDFPENPLSGSAHFWLGKIYLFESNFREAAIIFAEGVQKFPNSIKAAEMYYELSKSFKEMNKIPEACKALGMLDDNYKSNRFAKDPEKIKDKLNCEKLN